MKNKDVIWPERNWVYPVNLNEAETWYIEGRKTFSSTVLKIINGEKIEQENNVYNYVHDNIGLLRSIDEDVFEK